MQFAVIGLNHGHVYWQVEGLLAAGAQCVGVYAAEKDLLAGFHNRWPQVPFREKADLLKDKSIAMIVSASINGERGALGVEALRNGKHYFVDKPPLTSMEDFHAVRSALEQSGKLMFVAYSERLGSQIDVKCKELVSSGAIGNLVHLMGLGPHKLNWPSRPQWMWNFDTYGGLICDIGAHQIDWFCWLTGQKIKSFHSRVGNFGAYPNGDFLDFGDAMLTADNGVTGYIRLDWYTPAKLPTYGDIRGMVIGTKGAIEIRRTINMGGQEGDTGSILILTNDLVGNQRVDTSNAKITWPQEIMESVRTNNNLLNPHDRLLHVMEMGVRLQREAERVK